MCQTKRTTTKEVVMAYRWNKTVDELKKQEELRKELASMVAKCGSVRAFALKTGLNDSWVVKLFKGDQRITDEAMDRIRKSYIFF